MDIEGVGFVAVEIDVVAMATVATEDQALVRVDCLET